jgi:hypothetical protein
MLLLLLIISLQSSRNLSLIQQRPYPEKMIVFAFLLIDVHFMPPVAFIMFYRQVLSELAFVRV